MIAAGMPQLPRIPEKPILTALAYIAAINLTALVVIGMNVGGSAVGGHIDNGRYFLSNHGRLTEVSEMIFACVKWHEVSVWITHGLAIGAAFVLALRDWIRSGSLT